MECARCDWRDWDLPMQFDLDASLNSGVVETEVEAERTSGTRHRYDQKKARYGGVIPYYTFDRLLWYKSTKPAYYSHRFGEG